MRPIGGEGEQVADREPVRFTAQSAQSSWLRQGMHSVDAPDRGKQRGGDERFQQLTSWQDHFCSLSVATT